MNDPMTSAEGRSQGLEDLNALWRWMRTMVESGEEQIDGVVATEDVVAGHKALLPLSVQAQLFGRALYPKARPWLYLGSMMFDGGTPPPVLVIRTGAGLVVFDGNHRIRMARTIGGAALAARIIDAPRGGDDLVARVAPLFVPPTVKMAVVEDLEFGYHPSGWPLRSTPAVERCATCKYGWVGQSDTPPVCILATAKGGAVPWIRLNWPACNEWSSGNDDTSASKRPVDR